MPDVTVLMAAYNAMPYLPEAVESILNQSIRDFTFIVVDDGSTDGTSGYLQRLTDPRVVVLRQDNKGLASALNSGLAACKTEFLARMDADDKCSPMRLELLLGFMRSHEEVVLAGTHVRFFVGKRKFSGPQKHLDHDGIRKALLAGVPAICHGACMMRTEAIRAIGGYRDLKAGQDIDMYLRISENGRLANIPDVLYDIRVQENSTCFARADLVRRDVRFSIECARCRAADVPEPSIDDVAERWTRRGSIRKLLDRIGWWSGVQYRKSMIDRGNGRNVRGLMRLGIASLLRPKGALRHVAGLLRRGKRGSKR
ncbi:MAG: glycosyltransferase family 2 protein [Phycisphaerae bacterium]